LRASREALGRDQGANAPFADGGEQRAGRGAGAALRGGRRFDGRAGRSVDAALRGERRSDDRTGRGVDAPLWGGRRSGGRAGRGAPMCPCSDDAISANWPVAEGSAGSETGLRAEALAGQASKAPRATAGVPAKEPRPSRGSAKGQTVTLSSDTRNWRVA
jgi:hypothetical protein